MSGSETRSGAEAEERGDTPPPPSGEDAGGGGGLDGTKSKKELNKTRSRFAGAGAKSRASIARRRSEFRAKETLEPIVGAAAVPLARLKDGHYDGLRSTVRPADRGPETPALLHRHRGGRTADAALGEMLEAIDEIERKLDGLDDGGPSSWTIGCGPFGGVLVPVDRRGGGGGGGPSAAEWPKKTASSSVLCGDDVEMKTYRLDGGGGEDV